MNYATNELQGAVITSSTTITVAGVQATELFYTESYGQSAAYSNVVVYVPFAETRDKIYLTYEAGDALEQQFLSAFQQVISTIQFTQ